MRSPPTNLTHLTMAKFIRYLQEVPSNVHELAEASGLSVKVARQYARALEKEGATRVVGWEKDSLGRYVTKVYALGHGKNMPKPAPDKSLNERRRERSKRVGSVFHLAASTSREQA